MTTRTDHNIGWLATDDAPTPGIEPVGHVPPLVEAATRRLRARAESLAAEHGGSLPLETAMVVVARAACDVENYAAERFAYDHPQTRVEAAPGGAGFAEAESAATLATFEGIRTLIDSTDDALVQARRDRDLRVLSLHLYDAHPNVAPLGGLHRSMLAKLIAGMIAEAGVQPTYMPATRGEALKAANKALAKQCGLKYQPRAKLELPDLAIRVDALALRRHCLTQVWRSLGILVVQPDSGFGVKAPTVAHLLGLSPSTVWRVITGPDADAELRALGGGKSRRKTRAKG